MKKKSKKVLMFLDYYNVGGIEKIDLDPDLFHKTVRKEWVIENNLH